MWEVCILCVQYFDKPKPALKMVNLRKKKELGRGVGKDLHSES